MTRNVVETEFPKVKEYMSKTNKPVTVSDVAEHLGTTNTTAYQILELMDAFGVVQIIGKGRKHYILKGVYSEEQIQAMLPPMKTKPPKRVHIPGRPRGRPPTKTPKKTRHDKFLDEYLQAMEERRERASLSDGPLALALLELPQPDPLQTSSKPPMEMVSALMDEKKPESLIKIRQFGSISHLPKDVRRLSQSETRYVKDLLKGLEGLGNEGRYNTVFARFSALKNGRYGDVFYLSMGTNSWDGVLKVTVDPSISNLMVLPIVEARRWASWNDFLEGIDVKPREHRGLYDEMLSRFMESEDSLVEITVKDRKADYVKRMLSKKIEEIGKADQIEASRVDDWVYLEKVE